MAPTVPLPAGAACRLLTPRPSLLPRVRPRPRNPRPPRFATGRRQNPVETDEAAIRRVIRSYQRAIETKDLALYRSVRATLTPAEETTLRNSFQQIDSQEISIRIDSLTVDGRAAVASLSRQDTLVTKGRRETRNSTQTLRFTKGAAGWVITN